MEFPYVSIIFPVRDGWPDTRACLNSIAGLSYPKEKLEVIIIDNNSVEKLKNQLAKDKSKIKKLKIRIIENKANFGFARAVNQGIKKTRGKYLLVTNNDIIFDKKFMQVLVGYSQKHPKIGIAGGVLHPLRPAEKTKSAGYHYHFWTGLISPDKVRQKPWQSQWLQGCCLLIKRAVVRQIGLFDDRFFFYFEDLDFSLRARKCGWQLVCHPQAIAYHKQRGQTENVNWPMVVRWYYRGKRELLRKYASFFQRQLVTLLQFTVILPIEYLRTGRNFFPYVADVWYHKRDNENRRRH